MFDPFDDDPRSVKSVSSTGRHFGKKKAWGTIVFILHVTIRYNKTVKILINI